jgi:hemolysin activation/secretion protein
MYANPAGLDAQPSRARFRRAERTICSGSTFHPGGASTLRGYTPGTLAGADMLRGRLEVARTLPHINVAVFTDYGWPGAGRGNDRDVRACVSTGRYRRSSSSFAVT